MNVKIVVSIILALLFSIIPLPELITQYRPLFLPLVCIYWSIYHSAHFGLGKAWIAGIILDALHSTTLGQTALALTIVIGGCLFYKRRFQLSTIFQQVLFIVFLCLLYQFIFIWIDSINDRPITVLARCISALMSALLWPILIILMQRLFFQGQKLPII